MSRRPKITKVLAPQEVMARLFSANPASVSTYDRKLIYDKLDSFGPDQVYERLARGSLMTEVALSLQVPITVFSDWWTDRATNEMQTETNHIQAEAFMAKAIMLLEHTPVDNPTEAGVLKKLADVYVLAAERLSPMKWGGKSKLDGSAPFTLVMDFGQAKPVGQVLGNKETSGEVFQMNVPGAPVLIESSESDDSPDLNSAVNKWESWELDEPSAHPFFSTGAPLWHKLFPSGDLSPRYISPIEREDDTKPSTAEAAKA